jgi:hypothetical protein
MFRRKTATLFVFALLAGCDQAPQQQPTSSAPAEVPATLVARVTFEEGHSLEMYKGAFNHIFYLEKGKLGTPAYGGHLVGKSDREIWTTLLPDKPLPASLAAPERSDTAEHPVFAKSDLLYAWPDEAECGCTDHLPEHPLKACWQNASGNTAWQSADDGDLLTAHSSVCNWGTATLNQTASYRTWLSWSTVVNQQLPPGWWGHAWHGNSAPFDFDWSSKVFVINGALANYAHVVRGMDHNWIAQ